MKPIALVVLLFVSSSMMTIRAAETPQFTDLTTELGPDFADSLVNQIQESTEEADFDDDAAASVAGEDTSSDEEQVEEEEDDNNDEEEDMEESSAVLDNVATAELGPAAVAAAKQLTYATASPQKVVSKAPKYAPKYAAAAAPAPSTKAQPIKQVMPKSVRSKPQSFGKRKAAKRSAKKNKLSFRKIVSCTEQVKQLSVQLSRDDRSRARDFKIIRRIRHHLARMRNVRSTVELEEGQAMLEQLFGMMNAEEGHEQNLSKKSKVYLWSLLKTIERGLRARSLHQRMQLRALRWRCARKCGRDVKNFRRMYFVSARRRQRLYYAYRRAYRFLTYLKGRLQEDARVTAAIKKRYDGETKQVATTLGAIDVVLAAVPSAASAPKLSAAKIAARINTTALAMLEEVADENVSIAQALAVINSSSSDFRKAAKILDGAKSQILKERRQTFLRITRRQSRIARLTDKKNSTEAKLKIAAARISQLTQAFRASRRKLIRSKKQCSRISRSRAWYWKSRFASAKTRLQNRRRRRARALFLASKYHDYASRAVAIAKASLAVERRLRAAAKLARKQVRILAAKLRAALGNTNVKQHKQVQAAAATIKQGLKNTISNLKSKLKEVKALAKAPGTPPKVQQYVQQTSAKLQGMLAQVQSKLTSMLKQVGATSQKATAELKLKKLQKSKKTVAQQLAEVRKNFQETRKAAVSAKKKGVNKAGEVLIKRDLEALAKQQHDLYQKSYNIDQSIIKTQEQITAYDKKVLLAKNNVVAPKPPQKTAATAATKSTTTAAAANKAAASSGKRSGKRSSRRRRAGGKGSNRRGRRYRRTTSGFPNKRKVSASAPQKTTSAAAAAATKSTTTTSAQKAASTTASGSKPAAATAAASSSTKSASKKNSKRSGRRSNRRKGRKSNRRRRGSRKGRKSNKKKKSNNKKKRGSRRNRRRRRSSRRRRRGKLYLLRAAPRRRKGSRKSRKSGKGKKACGWKCRYERFLKKQKAKNAGRKMLNKKKSSNKKTATKKTATKCGWRCRYRKERLRSIARWKNIHGVLLRAIAKLQAKTEAMKQDNKDTTPVLKRIAKLQTKANTIAAHLYHLISSLGPKTLAAYQKGTLDVNGNGSSSNSTSTAAPSSTASSSSSTASASGANVRKTESRPRTTTSSPSTTSSSPASSSSASSSSSSSVNDEVKVIQGDAKDALAQARQAKAEAKLAAKKAAKLLAQKARNLRKLLRTRARRMLKMSKKASQTSNQKVLKRLRKRMAKAHAANVRLGKRVQNVLSQIKTRLAKKKFKFNRNAVRPVAARAKNNRKMLANLRFRMRRSARADRRRRRINRRRRQRQMRRIRKQRRAARRASRGLGKKGAAMRKAARAKARKAARALETQAFMERMAIRRRRRIARALRRELKGKKISQRDARRVVPKRFLRNIPKKARKNKRKSKKKSKKAKRKAKKAKKAKRKAKKAKRKAKKAKKITTLGDQKRANLRKQLRAARKQRSRARRALRKQFRAVVKQRKALRPQMRLAKARGVKKQQKRLAKKWKVLKSQFKQLKKTRRQQRRKFRAQRASERKMRRKLRKQLRQKRRKEDDWQNLVKKFSASQNAKKVASSSSSSPKSLALSEEQLSLMEEFMQSNSDDE